MQIYEGLSDTPNNTAIKLRAMVSDQVSVISNQGSGVRDQ